jgi:hypothetical protein
VNVPFLVALLLVIVFAAIGWPGARAVGRSNAWSLALTPAVAGLVAAFGVMASVLTRTSLFPWLAAAALIGWLVVARRRGRQDHYLVPDEPGVATLAAAVGVALLPVLLVDLPPVESDARFIWWFHAAWFRGGGSVARDGMVHPTFAPSHSGYPPLLPALVASVWHLGGAYDREVALRVSQLVTAAFIATSAFFTAAVLRLPRRLAMVAAAVVAGVCWGANASVGLSGFADLTWASAFLGAAVLLLAGPTDRRTIVAGALLVAVAALTKFEGGAAALLLAGCCGLRAGRDWRRVLPVALAAGVSLAAWVGVTTMADVPVDDRGDWSALVHLLEPGSVVHQRVVDTMGDLAGELGPLVLLGVVAIVAMVVLGRATGAPLRQPGLLLLLVMCAGYLAFLTAAVGVARLPLTEYTESGNYRTVLVVRLVVLVDVVLAAVAALRSVGALAGAPEDPAGQAPVAIH